MTTEDFLKKMRKIFPDRDIEESHRRADDLLVQFILERDPPDDNIRDAINLYCKSRKWYA